MCKTEKFCEKTKLPKFQTTNALFVYFSVGIFQGYCRISNKRPDTYQIQKF